MAAIGQNGVFVVHNIDSSLRRVEPQLIGHDFALSSIPWSVLTYLDELDTSHSALADRA